MSWSKNKESERPFFKRDMWYGFIKGDNIIKYRRSAPVIARRAFLKKS